MQNAETGQDPLSADRKEISKPSRLKRFQGPKILTLDN